MSSKLDIARQYVLENYNNGADFRWDILSRKLQVKVPTPLLPYTSTPTPPPSGGGREGATWVECDTRKINSIACACATEKQVNVTDREVRIVLNSEDIPAVNPLRDYLEHLDEYNPADHNNHSWIDWLSAQVTVKQSEEDKNICTPDLWKSYFKKWFVAMVAAWLYDNVVNQEVLVLIGRQGIYKTTWLEHLLPPCLRDYGTKMANINDLNKDERLRVTEFGLIACDELDAMDKRALNQFKSVVTTVDVTERAAYAYTKERRFRFASFCGSGNNAQFLTDDTGNRRWLPFEVEAIENPFAYGDGSVFPYAQIYGEALFLIRHGFNYWFDLDDIQILEQHNEGHKQQSSEVDLLPVYFSPANPGDPGAVFMSASEILALLVSYGNIRNPKPVASFGSLLQSKGFRQRKSNGHRGYVVQRILDVDEQRKIQARNATDQ